MSDLLGSILGNMKPPPPASKEIKEKIKNAKNAELKAKERIAKSSKKIRQDVENKLEKFLNDSTLRSFQFEPMERLARTIVYDAVEVAGLIAVSFNFKQNPKDDIKVVVVWKKEFKPCEDELSALRKGETWDPVKFAELKRQQLELNKEEEISRNTTKTSSASSSSSLPASGVLYSDKYKHLIDGGLEAVRSNRSYGMVSAEGKRDKRTVENIQDEIRAKKMKQFIEPN